ncbi:MAG: hypothetical protein CVV21_10525 [Candidatus Goldiibacteriota bacterium HGW-Goldbacteria-1]|nr:MAG: hypothetical protein CVV21_10525 [Candidatus Goldiibacteriota bacterium HGW-Goldbacteria-1]
MYLNGRIKNTMDNNLFIKKLYLIFEKLGYKQNRNKFIKYLPSGVIVFFLNVSKKDGSASIKIGINCLKDIKRTAIGVKKFDIWFQIGEDVGKYFEYRELINELILKYDNNNFILIKECIKNTNTNIIKFIENRKILKNAIEEGSFDGVNISKRLMIRLQINNKKNPFVGFNEFVSICLKEMNVFLKNNSYSYLYKQKKYFNFEIYFTNNQSRILKIEFDEESKRLGMIIIKSKLGKFPVGSSDNNKWLSWNVYQEYKKNYDFLRTGRMFRLRKKQLVSWLNKLITSIINDFVFFNKEDTSVWMDIGRKMMKNRENNSIKFLF